MWSPGPEGEGGQYRFLRSLPVPFSIDQRVLSKPDRTGDLGRILTALWEDTAVGKRGALFSLHQGLAHLREIRIPPALEGEDIMDWAAWEMENFLASPLSEYILSYRRTDDGRVVLGAVRQRTLNFFREVAHRAGTEVVDFQLASPTLGELSLGEEVPVPGVSKPVSVEIGPVRGRDTATILAASVATLVVLTGLFILLSSGMRKKGAGAKQPGIAEGLPQIEELKEQTYAQQNGVVAEALNFLDEQVNQGGMDYSLISAYRDAFHLEVKGKTKETIIRFVDLLNKGDRFQSVRLHSVRPKRGTYVGLILGEIKRELPLAEEKGPQWSRASVLAREKALRTWDGQIKGPKEEVMGLLREFPESGITVSKVILFPPQHHRMKAVVSF